MRGSSTGDPASHRTQDKRSHPASGAQAGTGRSALRPETVSEMRGASEKRPSAAIMLGRRLRIQRNLGQRNKPHYDQFDKVMTIGDASEQPNPARVVELLEHSEQSVAVNLLAIDIAKRPFYFADLLTHLDQLRARTARPHWIIIDEAHHMLPSAT